SDNAVSNDLGTKALKSNKGPSVKNLAEELDEDNYYLPEKPLYHVKKRPDGENYQEDNSYNEDYGSGYTNTSGLESQAKFENTSKAAPEKEIAKPKTKALTESKTVSPEKPSPSASTSTKVDNAASSSKPVLESGVYQVVVGAFSSQANASRYANQLQGNGWVAYSYLSGNLYRVAVGKLDNRSQAERLLTQIKQQVNAQAWVNLQ
ncbi:MAG: SPOR domain-containing protein, partial [Croceimicrobium sp.]